MEKGEQGVERAERRGTRTGLIVRKLRTGDDSYTLKTDRVRGNGHKNKEAALGIEEKVKELSGVLEIESETENGEPRKEALVFFDRGEGVKSTDSGEEQTAKDPGHEKPDSLSTNGLTKNYSTGIKYESNGLSSPKKQPSPSSPQEKLASYYKPSTEIESEDVDADELEVMEVDVVKVLEKQTTHDLYCPNCNSCITKRVILRKRKRRIGVSNEEAKWNRTRAAVDSGLGIGSIQDPSDKVDLANTQTPAADDDERDNIFRCLSCFSFFIPSGNGFKLFRKFGEKNVKKKVRDEQVPSVKKNWFASVFASNKPETAVDQDAHKSDVGTLSSSNLGDRSGQPLSVQKVSVNVVAHTSERVVGTAGNNDALIGREKFLSFPGQEPALDGKLLIRTTDAMTEQFEAHTSEELKASKRTPVTNGESAEDKKFLVPSHKGSPTTENLESEISIQKLQLGGTGQVYNVEAPKVDNVSFVNGLSVAKDEDTVITIDAHPAVSAETLRGIIIPEDSASSLLHLGTQTTVVDRKIEVVKSIVYGGLAESITSLSVVSAAAGGGAATLNILALGMANLIGGLLIISQNLWGLRSDCTEQLADQISNEVIEQRDRYREQLGQRENFMLHAVVAIISYLIFGLVPPVVYGFSFRISDDKEFKLVTIAASILLCIVILAIGKAYVCRPPKPYLKMVSTYVILGFMASGISYAAGVLVERLLEHLHFFQQSSVSNLLLPEMTGVNSARAFA